MLIGLTGRKGSGKDTVYERACRILAEAEGLLVERTGFADCLYWSAAAAFGVTPDTLRQIKNDPGAVVTLVNKGGKVMASLTVREYLQRYGTEAHRDIFGDDFWVEQVRLRNTAARVLFVTDVRFENEARAIKKAGGHVVRVVGPAETEHSGDDHASEAALPSWLIDETLLNRVRDDEYAALDEHLAMLLIRLRREEGRR